MRWAGVVLILAGLYLICFGWSEGQMGLHMRIYDRATWWQVELQKFFIVFGHSLWMKIGAGCSILGILISATTWGDTR